MTEPGELTPREMEALELAACGFSASGTARHVNVGIETAKSHVKRILRMLDARTIGQAISIAFVTFTFRIDRWPTASLERSRGE